MNKELSKLVSQLNWKVDESDVDIIVNELGDDAEKMKYGVKYYKVLTNIVCKKVDEELGLNEDEILCKSMVLGGAAFTNPTIAFSGSPVYYRIVVSKTKIYGYAFDYFFKLVDKFAYDLSEIKVIKLAKTGQDNLIPYDGYQIAFNDGKIIILYSMSKFAIKDLDDLKDTLVSTGIPYRDLKTKNTSRIYYFGMAAIVIVVLIRVFIMSM